MNSQRKPKNEASLSANEKRPFLHRSYRTKPESWGTKFRYFAFAFFRDLNAKASISSRTSSHEKEIRGKT